MQSRRRYYGKLIAILLLGVSFTLLLYGHQRALYQKDVLMRWELRVEQHTDNLRHAIAHNLGVLASLRSMFDTLGDVSREEFSRYTKLQLRLHPEIQALEWVPRIGNEAQRERFEQMARRDGAAAFRIMERGTGGQMVAARQRAAYYPVYYVQPQQGNGTVAGFDLASDPARFSIMEQAAASGTTMASGVIPHLLEANQQQGIVFFQPVYQKGAPLSSHRERKKALRGFVVGVYRLSDLMGTIGTWRNGYESLRIDDITDPASPFSLFDERGAVDQEGDFTAVKELSFAGRTWRITASVSPESGFLAGRQGWGILLIGSLLTLLLAAWYRSADRKLSHMEGLTGALRRTNDELTASTRRLQQVQRQWQRAVDALHHPIFLHDRDGCILQANHAYEVRAGRSFDSFAGEPYWHVFPVGDGPLDSCKKAIKLDGAEVDEELKLDDGSVFISRGFVVTDEMGEYEYSMHIMEDLTEKRRAEAQIRTHEARIQAVFKAPTDIAFIVTDFSGENGSIIEVNPGAETLFRHSKEELAGASMVDLVADENRERAVEIQRKIHRSETPWKGEMLFRRKDGSTFPTELLCYPVFSDEGVLSFTFCVIRDISKRLHSLELLQESEQRFRRIYERLPIGYQSTDPAGNLLEVNKTWLEILGYSEQEVLGRDFREFLQPEFHKAYSKQLGQLQQHGVCHSTELGLVCKDGRIFEALFEGRAAYGVNGEYEKNHCVFTDITERKRNERTLRRASRALEVHTGVNRVVMDSNDVDEMVQRMCEVVVNTGDYPMAWIGLIQEQGEPVLKRIGCFVQGGGAWPFQQEHYSLKRYSDSRNSLAVRAVLDNKTLASNLLPAEPLCDGCVEQESCQSMTEKSGLRSVIAIPLRDAGNRSVTGVMVAFSKDQRAFREEERQRLEVLANDLMFGIQWLGARNDRIQVRLDYGRSLLQTVTAIARSLEVRDAFATGHQQRVGKLAISIAREMGLDEHVIQGLELGGVVHDIGKLYIPLDVLNRPGKLSDNEFELIKSHPEVGYKIMADAEFPWPVKEMILQHHERIDGSGYPRGLGGDDIVLEAKILGVADVVEAMVSQRPYRPALGMDMVVEEIEKGSGKIYQPEIADACLGLIREDRFNW